MPWSPIPKFPEILELLNSEGNTERANHQSIKRAIMNVTGAYSSGTIRRIMTAMAELGWIRDTGKGNVFELTIGGTAWNFISDIPRKRTEEEHIDALVGEE